jgi:hypothetical protein
VRCVKFQDVNETTRGVDAACDEAAAAVPDELELVVKRLGLRFAENRYPPSRWGGHGCLWCDGDNPLRGVLERRNYGYGTGFATEGRLEAGGYCSPIGLAVPQERLGTLLAEAVRAWCG